jgi:uncharacterized protein involved in exopolysaccharide biosynthesis
MGNQIDSIKAPNHEFQPNSRQLQEEMIWLAAQFWKSKIVILALVITFTLMGVLIALIQEPVYQATALVMPKEGQKQSGISGALAGLGGMSGLIASQFGVGSANLDRMEIIVKGWELADSVITKHNLLKDIFQNEWDFKNEKWKNPDKKSQPTLRDGIDKMRSSIIQVRCDPIKNMMALTANASTAELAVRIVEVYLTELNNTISQQVINDSRTNQAFLNSQLKATFDPQIITKIQNLLGYEIEREMLVANKSFDVLEHPLPPTIRSKPKRKRIIGISLILGLATGCLVVFVKARRP